MITGTTGHDYMTGTAGDDQINAGMGNDVISGGGSTDQIFFSVGDGIDVVNLSAMGELGYVASTQGVEQHLIFNQIDSSSVLFEKHGRDLVIKYSASDQVTVSGYFTPQTRLFDLTKNSEVYDLSAFDPLGVVFSAPNHTVLVFDDLSLNFSDIDQMQMTRYPAQSQGFGEELLIGHLNVSNVMYGRSDIGMDLYGGNQNDVFYTEGSASGYADAMIGMDGHDQYIINGQGMAFAWDQAIDSGDYYQIRSTHLPEVIIVDQNLVGNESGLNDVLDLSLYRRDQFVLTRNVNSLVMSSSELNIKITIMDQFIDFDKIYLSNELLSNDGAVFFDADEFLASDVVHYNSAIETILFSDTSYTADQLDDLLPALSFMDSTSSQCFMGYQSKSNQLTGGASAENFYGGLLVDTIQGGAGHDKIFSYAGDDVIDGGLGNDTMQGGLGDDSYVVDSFSDSVIELAGEGTDKITTELNGYVLGANLEWLYLSGTTAVTASGNELDNRVYGNSLNNTLYGGAGNDRINGFAGNDTMIGGVGNDVYVLSNANDVIVEQANEGTDGVEASFSYALQDHVENLTLGGTAHIAGTGNSVNNAINGNGGNNMLDGRGGNDTLAGKAGNDTYLFNRGNLLDTIVENDSTAGNLDTVQYGADIASDQLWFKQVGNNLEVRVIGTTDRTVIRDWYLGDAYHVESFVAGNGKVLGHQDVDQLVSAMAGMSMPPSGQTTLTTAQQNQLASVFANTWM